VVVGIDDETVAGEALVLNDDEGASVAIDKDMEKLAGSGALNPSKRNWKKLELYTRS